MIEAKTRTLNGVHYLKDRLPIDDILEQELGQLDPFRSLVFEVGIDREIENFLKEHQGFTHTRREKVTLMAMVLREGKKRYQKVPNCIVDVVKEKRQKAKDKDNLRSFTIATYPEIKRIRVLGSRRLGSRNKNKRPQSVFTINELKKNQTLLAEAINSAYMNPKTFLK